MSTIVWWFEHSLVVPFLGIGMGIDLFQSCGHCWIFHIFWHIECSTWIVSSFRILNSSAGIPLPLLALLTAVLPKAHLPSHSRMFGLGWVTTPWWLCESLCSFFVQVFLCILSICSRSLLLLWSLYQFCSLLCSSLDEMFLWYFQFSEEKSSLFPSVVFPLFICIVHWRRPSCLFLLLSGTLRLVGFTFHFFPCFPFFFFPQLFVRLPQITSLLSCFSFPWVWFYSLPPVEYYEPLSIVLCSCQYSWS